MIDTVEEFIAAVYFTPVELSARVKARIEQHLPKNRTGVLKLYNMWKLKMAERPEMVERYAAAINLVRAMASDKDRDRSETGRCR